MIYKHIRYWVGESSVGFHRIMIYYENYIAWYITEILLHSPCWGPNIYDTQYKINNMLHYKNPWWGPNWRRCPARSTEHICCRSQGWENGKNKKVSWVGWRKMNKWIQIWKFTHGTYKKNININIKCVCSKKRQS